MEWWLLKYRLRFRFTWKQKAALAGKILMTKELFWGCLDVAYARFDMETFKNIWHSYPQYVKEFNEEYEREMSDPNSPKKKKADEDWKELRAKLVEEFGEEWVKEHCKD